MDGLVNVSSLSSEERTLNVGSPGVKRRNWDSFASTQKGSLIKVKRETREAINHIKYCEELDISGHTYFMPLCHDEMQANVILSQSSD